MQSRLNQHKFQQQRPFRMSLLISSILFMVVLLGDASEVHTTEIIRQQSQSYLDEYFAKFNTPNDQQQPRTSITQHSPQKELQQRIAACIGLSQLQMKGFRTIYREEAFKASKRLAVREDDSLRLFFVGDVLACLENIDPMTVESYRHSSQIGRQSFLTLSESEKIFKRTINTPLEFSDHQSRALASIVYTFLTIGGQSDTSLIDRLVSHLPISFLEGTMGICCSAMMLVAIIAGSFAVDSYLVSLNEQTTKINSSSPEILSDESKPSQYGKSKKLKRK